MSAYYGPCPMCSPCQDADCTEPVCPDNDPTVLLDCCNELRCDDCRDNHICWPSEVPC
jgi:hypothetical protein